MTSDMSNALFVVVRELGTESRSKVLASYCKFA